MPPVPAEHTTPYPPHATGLPVYCRYRDLVEAGITGNWPHLLRLIEDEGFPAGVMLSANIRAWDIAEVRKWLATRPTARKVAPPRKERGVEANAT